MAHPLEGYQIEWLGSPCYTEGRVIPIDHFTPHHVAGFSIPTFDWARQASSTYVVWGKYIGQYVSRANAPWTEGNYYGNHSGITCETVNAWGEPDWGWAEDSFDTTARLAAAEQILMGNTQAVYTGYFDPPANTYQHRDYGIHGLGAATRCPGEWMVANFTRWINLVNHYLNEYYNPAPPKPAITYEWKQHTAPMSYKCLANPTKLYKLEDGTAIKDFAQGDQLVIYGEVKRSDSSEWYYVTQYSYEKGFAQGFKKSDLEEVKAEPVPPTPEPEPEPSPDPVEITWAKWDAPKKYECAKQPTMLVNFEIDDVEEYIPVKSYDAGELVEIVGEAFNETVGLKFYVTEYSWEKQFTNGFYYEDLKEWVEPEPEDDTPSWFIRFIKALAEFLSNLFKK